MKIIFTLSACSGRRIEVNMYSEDIEKMCATCQKGILLPVTNDVVCEIYGVVAYNHICKKYKYDIFTKKVRRKKDITKAGFRADDFSID